MMMGSNDYLIYPRVTLMLATCLSFLIRVRRMLLNPVDHTVP
ncbi:MAG: hypothetical protein Q9M23_03135 [Mariprofundaceae bacterium]|nr:hypothetical protein [Mariprofundaceae bacterium]